MQRDTEIIEQERSRRLAHADRYANINAAHGYSAEDKGCVNELRKALGSTTTTPVND